MRTAACDLGTEREVFPVDREGGQGVMEHSREGTEDKNKGRKLGHFCVLCLQRWVCGGVPQGSAGADGWGWQRPAGTHKAGRAFGRNEGSSRKLEGS